MSLEDIRYSILKWFTYWWYEYLFGNGLFRDGFKYGIERLICRYRGHPCGVVFYNPSGWEPDYSCKNCGDEIC